MSIIVLTGILLLCLTLGASAPAKDTMRSVLLLDAVTFPKIVPNANHDIIVLISSKEKFGDYATDSMRTDYFNFALQSQTQGEAADHVIFAQIIVNGAENRKLAESIGIAEDFEHPDLFIFPAGSNAAIKHPRDEPFNIAALTRFAAQHSSLKFQLPGTMKKFDEIAADFMRTDPKRQEALILQAERELEELVDGGELETAQYYLKVMRKVHDEGLEFVNKEIKRLTRLSNDASKVTKAKARLLSHHINVLHHFKASIPAVPIRDEF
jgi:hypothetical protein